MFHSSAVRHGSSSSLLRLLRVCPPVMLIALIGHLPSTVGGSSSRSSPRPVCLGELYCYGPVSYRLAVGVSLQQSEGAYPVSLPLEIETRQSRCKLVLGTATFEAGPASRLEIRGEPSSLTLALASGSVLYAVDQTAYLTLTARGRRFEADGLSSTTGVSLPATGESVPGPAMGLLCVESESVRAVNLKGRLRVDPETTALTLAPGHSIQWNTGEQEPASPAAIGLPVSRLSDEPLPLANGRSEGASARGRAVEDWWIFPAPPDRSGPDSDFVALPMDDNRWLPVVPPPEPRNIISPWMPPPRRRFDPPDPAGPAPPWLPPGQFR